MNKQKKRYTRGFPKAYKMPVDEFCTMYDRNLKVVMHRLNVSNWDDFDALVVPTNLGDTKPPLIKRVLRMLQMNWGDEEIAKRLSIPVEHVVDIKNLSDYEKEIYSDEGGKYFKNYFFLNPEAIDVARIFHKVTPEKVVANE